MDAIIQVEQLSYAYGPRLALDQLSFEARPGEVLGLLGPNGAGKTTTVRLLNGLLAPSGGEMRLLGLNPALQGDAVRRHTGVLTETPALYERLTASQNLHFFGVLAGMPAADLNARRQELLAFFELSERADQRVATYSKGMKQRLALARTLLHRPQILFLDEPTAGLDPEAAQRVHELVESICRKNGQTVVLCTHNLVEAERLCDRMVILDQGRLLAFGSLSQLRQQLVSGIWVEVTLLQALTPENAARAAALPGVLQAHSLDALHWRFQVQDQTCVPLLASGLVAEGAALLSFLPRQVSLEEIYFQLQRDHRMAHSEVQDEP